MQSLAKYISESQCLSEEMQMDSFDVNGDGYDILDSSKKLRILNFLCDEVLGTEYAIICCDNFFNIIFCFVICIFIFIFIVFSFEIYVLVNDFCIQGF